ncbi:hypothetical protein SeLEV6574_g07234 [Synchytrium endobioticum]|uniref:Uncharacterized protein n=1 Tax=Synchytrium endobioticum TaxID=286115 RepID=A0A507CM14_9FUNG|nr:hypothetical protein SeLEV6574_g07234 [Synchytrium endobioticum]
MSKLSNIHVGILIVVFLMLRIRAANDDENENDMRIMRSLSKTLIIRRVTIAERTKNAQDDRACLLFNERGHLSDKLKERQVYVPKHSPLTLGQLSYDPDPERSREWLNYVMAYNAYQYERCKALYVKVSNTLHADGPRHMILLKRTRNSLWRYSRDLAELLKSYLSLEVKYAIVLGEVAPHFQTVSTTHDATAHDIEWRVLTNDLREERVALVDVSAELTIGTGRPSPHRPFMTAGARNESEQSMVSHKDATDDSVLGLKYSPLSPEELSMEPTPDMSDERLRYVMEYNALMFDKYRFKSAQLTKVLDDVPMTPEFRHGLENQQEQVRAMMESYLSTEHKYAEKLRQTAPHARLDSEEDYPQTPDLVNTDGEGTEASEPVSTSDVHAPVASSTCVNSEGQIELDLDGPPLKLPTGSDGPSNLLPSAHDNDQSPLGSQALNGPADMSRPCEPPDPIQDTDAGDGVWDIVLDDITELPNIADDFGTPVCVPRPTYDVHLSPVVHDAESGISAHSVRTNGKRPVFSINRPQKRTRSGQYFADSGRAEERRVQSPDRTRRLMTEII